MKKILIVPLILSFVIVGFVFTSMMREETNPTPNTDEIRYVAIGDSYTIGEGVGESERYPNIIVETLREKGINIALVANPSVTGYTVEDAIEYEVPILAQSQADFVTILIGANNFARGESVETTFGKFVDLLDKVQERVSNHQRIVIISVPDFLSSPAFVSYRNTSTSAQLERYNQLLQEEVEKRNLMFVDIYSITQNLENKPDLFVSDGLHPSAKQYHEWVTKILPVVEQSLKE